MIGTGTACLLSACVFGAAYVADVFFTRALKSHPRAAGESIVSLSRAVRISIACATAFTHLLLALLWLESKKRMEAERRLAHVLREASGGAWSCGWLAGISWVLLAAGGALVAVMAGRARAAAGGARWHAPARPEVVAHQLRRRRQAQAEAAACRQKEYQERAQAGVSLPDDCICPISLSPMLDPVVADDGVTYERASIERWFRQPNGWRSPWNAEPLTHQHLVENLLVRRRILETLDALAPAEGGAEGGIGSTSLSACSR